MDCEEVEADLSKSQYCRISGQHERVQKENCAAKVNGHEHHKVIFAQVEVFWSPWKEQSVRDVEGAMQHDHYEGRQDTQRPEPMGAYDVLCDYKVY